MSSEPSNDLNIDGIQDLLKHEDPGVQNLFKRTLNFYVSNDALRKTDDEKFDQLKKAVEDSLK